MAGLTGSVGLYVLDGCELITFRMTPNPLFKIQSIPASIFLIPKRI